MRSSILSGTLSESFAKLNSIVKIIVLYKTDNIYTLIVSLKICAIQFWNFNDKTLTGEIPKAHENSINSLLVNDKVLISAGSDGKIKFWEINSRKELNPSIDNSAPINCMVQDKSTLIVDSNLSVNLYNLKTKTKICEIKTDHTDVINKLFVLNTTQNTFILTGSYDKMIKVFDKDKKHENNGLTLKEHTSRISAFLQLKSNQNVFLSADYQGNIISWKINEKFKVIHTIKRNEYSQVNVKQIYAMFLDEIKNKNILISGSYETFICFWNLPDYALLRSVKMKYGLESMILLEELETMIFGIASDLVIWKN